LPREILTRRKQGFSPPFSAWARGPLRGLVLDALSPARVAAAGVLDVRAVQNVVREHLDYREDRGRTVWTLLSLQSWAERWVRVPQAVMATSADEQAPPAAGAAQG
jgi:asparagine synthase (glutamine-hydrolysing)